MKPIALSLALLLSPAAALAQAQGKHLAVQLPTLLDGVACNAAAATRMFTVARGAALGYGLLVVSVGLTRGGAATSVGMSCEGSTDGGTTWGLLQDCTASGGVCTSNDASWAKAVSGNKTFVWRVDILGMRDVRCTLTCTGGTAADVLTVKGYLVTQ